MSPPAGSSIFGHAERGLRRGCWQHRPFKILLLYHVHPFFGILLASTFSPSLQKPRRCEPQLADSESVRAACGVLPSRRGWKAGRKVRLVGTRNAREAQAGSRYALAGPSPCRLNAAARCHVQAKGADILRAAIQAFLSHACFQAAAGGKLHLGSSRSGSLVACYLSSKAPAHGKCLRQFRH